jgi:spore germination protein YaaH
MPVGSLVARILLGASLVAGCAAPPIAMHEEPRGLDTPGPQVWAYHAYWMKDTWRAYDLRDFGRILFFDLVAGKDGRIEKKNGWPEAWGDLRNAARDARLAVDPVVSVLDKETFISIFASPANSERLLEEAARVARDANGMHLDIEVFEPVDEAILAEFRVFLARLRARLDAPPRKVLTAFVTTTNLIYGERELALLDAVVAQGYDAHWQTAPTTGPVAVLEGDSPVAWKNTAVTLAARGVPARRIIFSTPLYGYEWPAVSPQAGAATTGPAEVVTYARIPFLEPDIRIAALDRIAKYPLRRDAATSAPWYAFYDKDGWHQGWFDDAASLAPRLDFTLAGDYLGVALWILGYDDGAMFSAVRARFRERSAPAGDASPRGGP